MKHARPEDMIQKAVFEQFRQRAAKGVFAFHVPNQGKRSYKLAAALKAMGMRAGVPDLIAVHKGRVYALELKAEGGRPTAKQLDAISALREAGAHACVAEGLDAALRCLEQWGLLIGRAA